MSQMPDNEHPRVTEIVKHAIELEKENEIAFATQILADLVAQFPAEAVAHGYLGWILSCSERHREAIEHCRVAIQLAPRSERVSLLLFRVLWGAGERDLAFAEMKRFVTVGRSEEYLNLINELHQAGL